MDFALCGDLGSSTNFPIYTKCLTPISYSFLPFKFDQLFSQLWNFHVHHKIITCRVCFVLKENVFLFIHWTKFLEIFSLRKQ